MLLGKRPRPPIKRTTSMTGITVDLSNVEGHDEQSDQTNHRPHTTPTEGVVSHNMNGFDFRVLGPVSPTNHWRNSGDFLETPHFLRTCGLCNRRLAPGRDIYMYRGDAAFCSLECREQKMKQDERKEKCCVASSKKDERHAATPAATS